MRSFSGLFTSIPKRGWIVLFSAIALIAAHLFALIYRVQPVVSLWFPPAGVAIALTIWFGPMAIVTVGIISVLMAPLWGSGDWVRFVGLADVVEPLLAFILYQQYGRQYGQGSFQLNTLKHAALFILSVPLVACATSAILGNLLQWSLGRLPASELLFSMTTWWLGNALGVMTIAPLALLLLTPQLQRWDLLSSSNAKPPIIGPQFTFSPPAWIEGASILGLTLGFAILTVSKMETVGFEVQQLSFLNFIPILWAAIRFGATGGILTASFCVIATLLAYLVNYPTALAMSSFPVEAGVFRVHQFSLLVQCMVGLLMGTAITDRSESQVALAVEQARTGEYQMRAQLTEQLMNLNHSLADANTRLAASNHEKDELLVREQSAHAEAEVVRDRLTHILESITEAFFTLDNEWRFTYINQQAEQLLQAPKETLLHQTLWQMYPALVGSIFDREYHRAIAEQVTVSFPAFYAERDIWTEVRAYPSPQGLSVFLQDITERKRLESERNQLLEREQAARSEAERANRIKDEFLAILSHELRSPLNAILGWAQLLRTRQFDEATRARAIETIERNARSQNQLIEDLIDISRILRGKISLDLRPVNLQAVVEAAIDTVRLTADTKSIQLQFSQQTHPQLVKGDPTRLQQVVWNLLTNAVKFTPEGGRVEIQLTQQDQQVQLQIRDSGKGIKSEFLPYIFDHFRQADASTARNHGGLGLGLSIVRHLVELHQGTVAAQSLGEGQGSIFTVQLPVASTTTSLQSDKDTAPILTFEHSLAGLQVLLVDDEADTRELLSFTLEQCGAEVRMAASVPEAIAILESFQADVLLSDIGMPGEDGYSLIRKVRASQSEQTRKIPAAALTAYVRPEDQAKALSAGFQMHLSKPIEPQELIAVVTRLAQQAAGWSSLPGSF